MSKVETKEDLLHFMEAHWACPEATEWVKSRKEKTFLEIWNVCPSYDWLLWMMYEQDPELAYAWEKYVYAKIPLENSLDAVSSRSKRLAAFKRAYRGDTQEGRIKALEWTKNS